MKEYSVIITGDFNAESETSVDKSKNPIIPKAVRVPKDRGFKSLYDNTLKWSSWKKRPAGSTDKYKIDYVFGSNGILAQNALGGVDDDFVNEEILLPNYNSGSDHISLVVEFQLSDSSNRLAVNWQWLTLEDCSIGIGSVIGAIAVGLLTIIGMKYLEPVKRSKEPSPLTSVQ